MRGGDEPPFFYIMRIVVNKIPWEVSLTSDTSKLQRDDGSLTLGVTDTNTNTVSIWHGLNPSMLKKVLLHELSHVFIHSYGYSMAIEEEEFICAFIDTYAEDIVSLVLELLSSSEKKLS